MSDKPKATKEPHELTREEVAAHFNRLVAEGLIRLSGPSGTKLSGRFQRAPDELLIQLEELSAAELLILAVAHRQKRALGIVGLDRSSGGHLIVPAYVSKRLREVGVSPSGKFADLVDGYSEMVSALNDAIETNAEQLGNLIKEKIDPLIEKFAKKYKQPPKKGKKDQEETVDPAIRLKVIYYRVSDELVDYIENKLRSHGLDDLETVETAGKIIAYFENPARWPARPVDERQADLLIDLLLSTNAITFNRVAKLTLPERAPFVWSKREDREEGENVVQFLRRVWGRYMDAGILYQDDIKRLGDPKLVASVRAYCHHHGLDAASVLPPPKRVRLERALAQVEPGTPAAILLQERMRHRQETARRRKRGLLVPEPL